jgi:hypothetical protein
MRASRRIRIDRAVCLFELGKVFPNDHIENLQTTCPPAAGIQFRMWLFYNYLLLLGVPFCRFRLSVTFSWQKRRRRRYRDRID